MPFKPKYMDRPLIAGHSESDDPHAYIVSHYIYPNEARRLAAWLTRFAEWAESKERK